MIAAQPKKTGSTRLKFALAFIVLGGGAAGMQAAKAMGWLQLIKKPLPIRKPLPDMDVQVFSPWQASGVRMRPESAEELGTTEYAMWNLRNPAESGATGSCTMFLSYYTGVQDQVPHVPEECMTVHGSAIENFTTMEDVDIAGQKASLRKLSFLPTPNEMQSGDVGRKYVYYLIGVNGDLLASRDAVRIRMSDFRDSHLYYSKVELAFRTDAAVVDEGPLDRAALDLMNKTVTELFKAHWPRKGAERGGGEGAGG